MPTKILNTSDEESELRRGPWTLEEDNLLDSYIRGHGEGRWNHLAKCAGLKRTGKSCRLRWLNYLKPDVKRGNLTPQEQLVILELHSKWGNRWSKIAQQLPGRTDNEIKNYWRTRVQKQARQLNIDTNSDSFLNAIRCFWMPNMVQNYTDEVASSQFTSPYSPTMNNNSYTEIAYSLSPQNQNHLLQIPVPDNYSTPATIDHFSEQQPPSPYAMDNMFYNSNKPFIDCNNFSLMETSSYDLDCYNPAMEMDYGGSMQIRDVDWGINESLPIWNMDDYWPFRSVD